MKKETGHELNESDRTLVMLISGRWRQNFPNSSTEMILSSPGDYALHSGQMHESEALEDSHVMVVRWVEN
ncbi:MAG: hypothetical protein AUJ19_04220 [Parcubacteria group bacterium CG1_02_58_44]|nr:MAG: hypothetical protein AUJ19_04220 [Parcubacteria group bacterium CG1_02_58_44]